MGGMIWGEIYIPLAGCIARREAPCFARGVRGHAPPRKIFLKGAIWCVLVYIWIRFCVQKIAKLPFFIIKSLKFSFFYINFLRNTIFYINTRLLWCNSREEMFGIVSRLMRFGVHFEITLNRK